MKLQNEINGNSETWIDGQVNDKIKKKKIKKKIETQ